MIENGPSLNTEHVSKVKNTAAGVRTNTASIAQLGERSTEDLKVPGSILDNTCLRQVQLPKPVSNMDLQPLLQIEALFLTLQMLTLVKQLFKFWGHIVWLH